VEDVLKLTRAKIGDEIVVRYIQNSGTIYSLAPQDIVYLKNQGVSDRVMNTMLDQRGRVEAASQQAVAAAAAAAQSAPAVAPAPIADSAPSASSQPAATYVESAPSTVYVIPYNPVTYPYYGYYGGYYNYYGPYGYYGPYHRGWYRPSVSVGVHFGGGFRGGFHGPRGHFSAVGGGRGGSHFGGGAHHR
jgi:hypothetical protein